MKDTKIILKVEQDLGHGIFAAKAWGDKRRCNYFFSSIENKKMIIVSSYILVQENDGGNVLNCMNENCLYRKGSCSCEEIKCFEMEIFKGVILSKEEAEQYIKLNSLEQAV